jgi:hypothetical protein
MTKTHEVRALLLGAWSLVSWEAFGADGTVFRPLGDDGIGQLIYDGSGRMSAQLSGVERPLFADEDWLRARPDEIVAAWPGYFAYFGTFSVDVAAVEAPTVTHHISSGTFPNLAGTEQVRTCRFDDGDRRLSLTAESVWGSVRIVWERVR